MKEGFNVETDFFAKNDNCILVYNYFGINEVFNMPIRMIMIRKYKDQYSIGVWKIKSLKN